MGPNAARDWKVSPIKISDARKIFEETPCSASLDAIHRIDYILSSIGPWRSGFAKVAELADALDLGSSPARGGGSNPPFRSVFSPAEADGNEK